MHSLRQKGAGGQAGADSHTAQIDTAALESLAQVCYIQISCGIKYRSAMGNRPEYGMVWRCVGENMGCAGAVVTPACPK
jgi:hypothetical protein